MRSYFPIQFEQHENTASSPKSNILCSRIYRPIFLREVRTYGKQLRHSCRSSAMDRANHQDVHQTPPMVEELCSEDVRSERRRMLCRQLTTRLSRMFRKDPTPMILIPLKCPL